MSRIKPRAKLRFEALENRNLMAGLVTAAIENGDLIIRGDAGDNNVAIYGNGDPYNITIEGGKLDDTAPTTFINGSEQPLQLSGFTGNLKIQMGSGNDRVFITNLTVHGDTLVNLGAGDDGLLLYGFTSTDGGVRPSFVSNLNGWYSSNALEFQGSVLIQGESGNDLVTNTKSVMASNLTLNAGSGDDMLRFSDPSVTGNTVANMGAGNDYISVSRTPDPLLEIVFDPRTDDSKQFGGGLNLNLGAGDDYVLMYSPSRIPGVQNINISGEFSIYDPQAGKHGEYININNLKADGGMKLNTAQLNDYISLDGVITPSLRFNTSSGDDHVTIERLQTQTINFNAGAGNDLIYIEVQNTNRIDFHAGAGDDTVSITGAVAHIYGMLGNGNDIFGYYDPDNSMLSNAWVYGGFGNDMIAGWRLIPLVVEFERAS